MILKVDQFDHVGGTVVSIRCPSCKKNGTFDAVGIQDLRTNANRTVLGQRRCPDPGCHAHVFFIHTDGKIQASYPAERLDFDATNIPAAVTAAIEEAITCHANGAFVAATMMGAQSPRGAVR